ncbi:MAG: hypothetical protein RQ899_14250 [Pseudomonadales bacterium]|nr:hypothetical protein [Pseudomonadales bacterium]
MNKTSLAAITGGNDLEHGGRSRRLLLVFMAALFFAFAITHLLINTGPGEDSGSGMGGTGKFGESGMGGTGGPVINLGVVDDDKKKNGQTTSEHPSRVETIVQVKDLKLTPASNNWLERKNLVEPVAGSDMSMAITELKSVLSEVDTRPSLPQQARPDLNAVALREVALDLDAEKPVTLNISVLAEQVLTSSLEITRELMLAESTLITNYTMTSTAADSLMSIDVLGRSDAQRKRISLPARPDRPERPSAPSQRFIPVERVNIPSPPVRPMRL